MIRELLNLKGEGECEIIKKLQEINAFFLRIFELNSAEVCSKRAVFRMGFESLWGELCSPASMSL
jgi:hypothetical protein